MCPKLYVEGLRNMDVELYYKTWPKLNVRRQKKKKKGLTLRLYHGHRNICKN